jgi:dihydrofolate synthase/folylpolyglutamate synthase
LLDVLASRKRGRTTSRPGPWRTPQRTYAGLRPALVGAHQIHNLRVALLAFETLAGELGFAVAEAACVTASPAVRWPGRLQRIEGNPPLLLDGAHNASGRSCARGGAGTP